MSEIRPSRVTHIKLDIVVLFPFDMLKAMIKYGYDFEVPRGGNNNESNRMMRTLLNQMKVYLTLDDLQKQEWKKQNPLLFSKMIVYAPSVGWIDYESELEKSGFSVRDSIIYKIKGRRSFQFFLNQDAYGSYDEFIKFICKMSSAQIKVKR